MSQSTLLLIFAIINVIVLGIFAGTILRQYLQRRREAQLYWSLALLMAFLATLAYIFLIVGTPTSEMGKFFFRLYYVLGAALTPAWLGLGSIALVTGKRTARTGLFLLSLLSLLAVVTISEATMNLGTLAQIAATGSPGAGILEPSAWLPTLIVLNSAGVVAIVGVAIYSGWKLLRRQSSVAGLQTRNLLWANVLILGGALCNAAAGTLARLVGLASGFWLIMALGWIIFYLGVLMTGRRKRILSQSEQPAQKYDPHVLAALGSKGIAGKRGIGIPASLDVTGETDWVRESDLPYLLALGYEMYGIENTVDISITHAWWKKNPYMCRILFDKKNRKNIWGAVTAMPMEEETILEILRSGLREQEIKPDDILTYEKEGKYCGYISSAMIRPEHRQHFRKLLESIFSFWCQQYPRVQLTRLYAFAASDEGLDLMRHFFFAPRYDLGEQAFELDPYRRNPSRFLKSFQECIKRKASTF